MDNPSSMKWFITKLFIGLGILASVILFIFGVQAYNLIDNPKPLDFISCISPSLYLLFGTAVSSVILVGICQIVDELRKANETKAIIKKQLIEIAKSIMNDPCVLEETAESKYNRIENEWKNNKKINDFEDVSR